MRYTIETSGEKTHRDYGKSNGWCMNTESGDNVYEETIIKEVKEMVTRRRELRERISLHTRLEFAYVDDVFNTDDMIITFTISTGNAAYD